MRRKRGDLLIFLGLLMILSAVLLVVWNRHQAQQAAVSAEKTTQQLNQIVVPKELTTQQVLPLTSDGKVLPERSEREYPNYILNPRMDMPEETIGGWDYIGILEIPDLDLELPVISHWSYPALKVAPARYEGSIYLDNLVIAAHNYNSHFGRIYTLSEGSWLTFTDMDGNVFVYEAAVVETLGPTDVEEMHSGDWDLTLFTCTVGGRSRVTVRFNRVEAQIQPIGLNEN